MTKQYFKTLASFNSWANNKTTAWLNEIDDEQWEQLSVSSFSSIKQTVLHIASAEKIWSDFWRSKDDPVYLSAEFEGSKNDLIVIWKKASGDLEEFIDIYPEENYSKQVVFKYPRGGQGQMEYWRSFAHCINHSTYHRGQLITLLRQAGFTKLSSLDLATYYLKR